MSEHEIEFTIRMHRDSGWIPDELEHHCAKRWKIEIEDKASGMRLGELRLDDEQWAAMHTGTGGEGVATIPSVEIFRRIGKTSWNVSVGMDYDWNVNDPYFKKGYNDGHRNDHGLSAHVQYLGLATLLGGQTVSTKRHNSGLSVTVRGYADSPEQAAEAAAHAAEKLNEVASEESWKGARPAVANPTAESIAHDREYREARSR